MAKDIFDIADDLAKQNLYDEYADSNFEPQPENKTERRKKWEKEMSAKTTEHLGDADYCDYLQYVDANPDATLYDWLAYNKWLYTGE